jgi:hypothetical protein
MPENVNPYAVLAAAVSMFMVGGLWYSPVLFARAWQRAADVSDEQVKSGSPAKIFGLTFVFSLVMAANLAMFLADPKTDTAWGATAGLLAGFGWVTLSIGILALFERRPWKYVAINGGYLTISFVIMGAILGAWR